MTALPSPPARRWAWALIILVSALAPYVRAVEGDFVWTDHHFVENNRSLQAWHTVPRLFVTDAWQVGDDQRSIGYYRPIRNLTLIVDTKLFGPNAAGYHVTNLVIHALCALLAFGVVYQVFRQPALAGFTALFFAVHPVHIEAVAWIIGRTDSCAALGYLAALYAWLRAHGERFRLGWWLLGCVGAAWGLLSKESAATLPAVLALCFWARNTGRDRRLLTIMARCAPAAVLTVLYLAVRGAVLSSVTNHPLWGGTGWSNALTAISLLGPYARMLVTGGPLIAVYEEHIRTTLTEPAVLAGLAVALVVLGAMATYRRFPRIAFGAGWFAFTILPVMHILPFKVLLAERFMYLPSLGWCVILATVVTTLARRQQFLGALFGALITLGFGVATARHVPVWQNDFTLFADSLRKAPESTEAMMGLARAHYDAGQFPEAREKYTRATEINPTYYLAWYNLGLTHLELGDPRAAHTAFARATDTNPDYTAAWWAYGRNAYALEELDVAAHALGIVATRQPTGETYLYWARALGRSGHWSDAARAFLHGISGGVADPHFAAEAAHALAEAGQYADAEDWAERARAAGPEFRAALQSEAARAASAGETGHARYLARVAVRLAPDDPRTVLFFVGLAQDTDPHTARSVLADYASAHPDDVQTGAAYVGLLVQQQARVEAERAARALLAAHPDAAAALVAYATERRAAGDLTAALDAAQRAGSLQPEDARVALLTGEIALEAGHHTPAVTALERARTAAPEALPVLRALARAYRAAGRFEDAAATAHAGLAHAPDDPLLLAVLDEVERETP